MFRRVLIPVLAALLMAAPVTAQQSTWAPEGRDRDRDRDRGGFERQDEVPLSSILRDLRMRYGGQHLDTQQMGGRYVISWITEDGRRLVIEVDASSGRTLSVRG
ncbi:MAG: hypothetical protein SGJ21_11480 [Alphaproteobacteria bacterium]|nr:hypothetical protein [Alphaproteobacteria bacterium]